MSNNPEIDPLWVTTMIVCGGIGVLAHILIVLKTFPLMFQDQISAKGKILIFGCILVYTFNGIACLIWLLFRTNILITLSALSCKFIYVSNFLCYFVAKYILHIILISRTYLAFIGTPYRIQGKIIIIYMSIVSLHFFVTVILWTREVYPHVLKGAWMNYSICTLFSETAENAFAVKLCAVLVGAEDFIVGGITLYIILKRLMKVSENRSYTDLIQKTIRYGIVSCVAMISTLFLFTLAIPFWPNITFIIAIDATINSFCVFCVLSVGSKTYEILCYPFRICEKMYVPDGSDNLQIIIHSEVPTFTSAAKGTEGNNTKVEKRIETQIQLQNHYSEPLNCQHLQKEMMKKQLYAVSNPIFK